MSSSFTGSVFFVLQCVAIALFLVPHDTATTHAATSPLGGRLPNTKTVMMWANPSDPTYAEYLRNMTGVINAISPTIYHLAADGVSLDYTCPNRTGAGCGFQLERDTQLLKASVPGLRVYPTIYEDESHNMGTLRPRLHKLFASPDRFIHSLINTSVANGWDGVNLDFEPRWRASPQDAADMLAFVNKLSDAMHAVGKVVSLDATPCVNPTWQGVQWQNNCHWYDMNVFNSSRLDSYCNMWTYTEFDSLFIREITDDVNHFGVGSARIGLGLDSQAEFSTGGRLNESQLQLRFDLIESLGLREIDIWVQKVEPSWIPYLRKFLASP